MISFIIPAYNEEKELPATLQAIDNAGRAVCEDYEIIVVDDASTDSTVALAGEFGARVVAVNHRQIGATRNSGAAAASGDVFIFVDADTRVNPAVVARALEALDKGAVGGGARVRLEQPIPFVAKVLALLFVRVYMATGWAAGCFMYCVREAFERSGGFDETLYGAEEIYFSKAMQKQGPFVILRECVDTSSRKMRMYPISAFLGILFKLLLGGTSAVKKRKNMSMWYDGRRE